jgi:hypothetical protein
VTSEHGIILFHTTASAIRAEKTLAAAGLSVRLIPTPRELSSDCGVALRFDGSQAERARSLLAAARVACAAIQSSSGAG